MLSSNDLSDVGRLSGNINRCSYKIISFVELETYPVARWRILERSY